MQHVLSAYRGVSHAALFVAAGGVGAVGGAALISGEVDAMGIDFTYFTDVTKQMQVMTASVPVDSAPYSNLTYTSPSIKMTRQSDGVWRYVNHNILLGSQTLNVSGWGNVASSFSANATTAPDGTSTAEKLIESATSAQHYMRQRPSWGIDGAQWQFSVYLKAAERTFASVHFNDDGAVNRGVVVDLSNGTIGTTTGTVLSSSISSAGSGWYRVTVVAVVGTSVDWWARVSVCTSDGAIGTVDNYAGDGTSGVYVWGTQAKRYPVNDAAGFTYATGYLATTTAARYDLPYEWDVSNVSQGILIEEQRTNSNLRSQEIGNGSYTLTNVTVTSDATTAPDGTSTADYMKASGATSVSHDINQSVTASTAAWTLSVFAKKADYDYIWINPYDTTAGDSITYFNVANGTVGTVGSGITASIVDAGNGWYRCICTRTQQSSAAFPNFGFASADNTRTFAATTGQGNYFWGIQYELGSFATSPIHTVGATVTRADDKISLLVSAFPFSTTVGTVWTQSQGPRVTGFQTLWQIDDTSVSNRIVFRHSDDQHPAVVSGGALQASLDAGGYTANVSGKGAAAWAANDFAGCINAGSVATDGAGTVPGGLTTLRWEGVTASDVNFCGYLKKFVYLKRRATNGELQTFTT